MDSVYRAHLDRVRAAVFERLGRKDAAAWIERNTYLNGAKFSFVGHEYQKRILEEDAQEIVIRKSAQTGISEMALRNALALVMLMPGSFRIGYILPTAHFASSYSQTRFNPIIQTSPTLRQAVSSNDIDSAEVKTFGVGKEIYFKGAAVGNAAISTTLDMLIRDEASFCDQTVLGDYHSRLIHSKYKWGITLSTPTFPGDPIDQAFLASRRHWNACKCGYCGHTFIPDYYDHVRIPGFDKHLDEITKDNLHTVRYQEARLFCPACDRNPSLLPDHRLWICENPDDKHIATGFQVQPFDAPTVVTLSDLVVASTRYATKAKFRQFSLGKPAVDAEAGLTEEEIEAAGVNISGTPFTTHVMGIDLGLTCHFTIGGMGSDGRMGVVHYERVPLARFRERYAALTLQYRISIKVSDIQPYTDLVMSISESDPNLYGASYVTKAGLGSFEVRQREADPSNALAGVRQVSVNRNAAFDQLLADIRGGKLWFARGPDWELFKAHLQDMKRASATLRNGEFTSMWQKSSRGADHYHHALNYLNIANQMRGIATGAHLTGLQQLSTFKVKDRD